mgnify:CR=1 FL=1
MTKQKNFMEVYTKDNLIYDPLRNKYLNFTPEERVRQEYVCRLVNYYGYDLLQMDREVQVNNSHRGQGKARADIVIWKSAAARSREDAAVIVVECKAEHITIREEDYFQGYNYASWAGADFFVTTNLKETRVFKVVKGKLPKRLEEIVDIPRADELGNDKKIKELLSQTKAFTRDEFSKLLFKCHNIIRNNDKLSPEAAFDEISKVLFIKILFERKNTGGQIFSKAEFVRLRKDFEQWNSTSFYQSLFKETKNFFKNDNLFDNNDTIKIKEASFEAIVKELQVYNLSHTADDIKGIAFEKFLGRTFRGELGQFFTPRTIVEFMVNVLDPQEGEYICDPCCGSGGFLINAFEYVRAQIEQDIEAEKEKIKETYYTAEYDKLTDAKKEEIDTKVAEEFQALNQELDINNTKGRLRSLSFDCIYGTDANPRMARTAKMNMIMHGDGHGGVHHHDGLLNVNGIFDGRFDIILTNPPFGAHVDKDLKITEADIFTDEQKILAYTKRYGNAYVEALKQVNDHIGESLLSLFETGKMSGLTEVLFIERCLNLLKPGGRMGIVLPEGVLNNTNLQKIRDFVESKAKIMLIVSIPQDVFMASGATVKPSLLFFRKFTTDEAKQYNAIATQAKVDAQAPYQTELDTIAAKLALRGKEALKKEEKAALKVRKKEIDEKVETTTKTLIKERFDYQIPIAEVQKAGISTTGAPIENELIPLEKEYTEYRKENNLW